ncbi:heavy metal-associated isoprenylated plant protein 47-like [Cornus florida]|uniref:heavy metal-associated isoprenylated plant protein 47-like n=1 Tax=Cornus florida TaxID=4283 RepID=UPI00289A1244|nr:heavy metal-associated isoprenylated plant protein 47-like [Cornus florida]
MQQKMVMQLPMKCKKCRSKALQVVAKAEGVSFVGFEGNEKNKVVVIGEGVDAVELTKGLRKKVGHADITSVTEVKPEKK